MTTGSSSRLHSPRAQDRRRSAGTVAEKRATPEAPLARFRPKLAGGFGELRVMKDGEHSLFFHQPQSGFCGGLIYHPATKVQNRLPYGDFSTHT